MNITNKIDMYLNESKIETIEEFTELVKRDCSEFLKEIKPSKHFLYRGVTSSLGDMGIKTPRSDRKPKDTSAEAHEYIGKVFKKYHGWNPRTEGVFCSGDENYTHHYGRPYIIFPVNGYKYLWSSKIADIYVRLQRDYDFEYKNVSGNYTILWNKIALTMFINDVIKKYKFEHEYDDNYIGLDHDDIEADVLEKAEKELNKLIKDYNKNNLTTLLNGSKYNEFEVALKCKKYYYIVWSGKIDDDLALSLFN
jgi:hypothetical protein